MIDGKLYGASLALILVVALIAYVVAWRKRRLDYADVAWGGLFAVAATASFVMQPDADSRLIAARLAVTLAVIVWAMRLSGHILHRVRLHDTEDPRYAAMRARWHTAPATQALLRIFVGQALFAMIVVTPVLLFNLTAVVTVGPAGWLLISVGLLVWLTGFIVELMADRQLRRFLARVPHKNALLTTGLWRYSRHPNYFGELVQWWGMALAALSVPHGWIGLTGPLLLTILIRYVSGVPLLERRQAARAGWAAYRRRTSVLIPWPPKGGT